MRRFAMTLAVLGILCFAAGQAQADGHYSHHGHHGWYAPVIVPRPVVVARPIVPVYPPVCGYRYYQPWPASGFYYRSPGLSIGVGF
jgi:hypothetical protein